MNDHTDTEIKLLESLQNQRDEVQTKLEKVENSIKAIDEILKNALSENAEFKRKECNLSNITKSKSFDMKKYVETKHEKHTTKECNVCYQTFVRNHELEAHLKTHTEVQTFPCDICGKRFVLKWRLKKHISGHYRKRYCHFFNNGKACPYEDIGCKFQHQVSPICKVQSCNITLCQYRHCGTYVTIETVEDNDKNQSAIDIDKICDEVLARAEFFSHNEEEDFLSDSFIDKIMKDRETKLNIVSTVDDDVI